MCFKEGNLARFSYYPKFILLNSGAKLQTTSERVYESPTIVSGEKNSPFALVELTACSSASALSFSSKVTIVTPALAAPSYVTMFSAEAV